MRKLFCYIMVRVIIALSTFLYLLEHLCLMYGILIGILNDRLHRMMGVDWEVAMTQGLNSLFPQDGYENPPYD